MGKDRRFVSPVIINIRGKSLQNVKLRGSGGTLPTPQHPVGLAGGMGIVRVWSQPPPRVAPLGTAQSPRQLYLIMPFCTICKESTKEGTRQARPGSSARRISSKNRNTIFHINGFDFSWHLKKHKTTQPPLSPHPDTKTTHPSIHPPHPSILYSTGSIANAIPEF